MIQKQPNLRDPRGLSPTSLPCKETTCPGCGLLLRTPGGGGSAIEPKRWGMCHSKKLRGDFLSLLQQISLPATVAGSHVVFPQALRVVRFPRRLCLKPGPARCRVIKPATPAHRQVCLRRTRKQRLDCLGRGRRTQHRSWRRAQRGEWPGRGKEREKKK